MKQVVYGIMAALMVVLTLGIVMSIMGKMNRQSDLDNAFSISVEDAVETTMNEKTYSVENNMEFIADFTQNLLLRISNDSDIQVSVAKIDYEKGLMSIRVTETFIHPNGKEGKNECETTVVFEKNKVDDEMVVISFLLDEATVYKEYSLVKGENVIVPKIPVVDGKTFTGWAQEGTGHIVSDFGTAQKDTIYMAMFH